MRHQSTEEDGRGRGAWALRAEKQQIEEEKADREAMSKASGRDRTVRTKYQGESGQTRTRFVLRKLWEASAVGWVLSERTARQWGTHTSSRSRL